MYKGLDSPKSLANVATKLRADGFTFVARYLFRKSGIKTLLAATEVKAFHAQSIRVVSVWEDGYPTQPSYFTATQGARDGADAAAKAKAAGQPLDSIIFLAADYDARLSEVEDYFRAAQKAVKAAGFYAIGVYGNGEVCEGLKKLGIVSATWLAQSLKWRGFVQWAPHADIIQGGEYQWRGIGVDSNSATALGRWAW